MQLAGQCGVWFGPLSDGAIGPLTLKIEGFDAIAEVGKGGNLHSTFLDIYV